MTCQSKDYKDNLCTQNFLDESTEGLHLHNLTALFPDFLKINLEKVGIQYQSYVTLHSYKLYYYSSIGNSQMHLF